VLAELGQASRREPEADALVAETAASDDRRKHKTPGARVAPGRPHKHVLEALAWFEVAGIRSPGRHPRMTLVNWSKVA
jgi:hypothetical protein